MPSVGMRRTTRVFGVSKSIDGARVLRSGKRLWPEKEEIKLRRSNDVDGWFCLINSGENGGGRGRCRCRGEVDCRWSQEQKLNSKPIIVTDLQEEDIDREIKMSKRKLMKPVAMVSGRGGGGGSRIIKSDRMYGNVYIRKRKRTVAQEHNVSVQGEGEKVSSGNRMFGLQFFRRQRKKENRDVACTVDSTGKDVSEVRYSVFTVYTGGSCRGSSTFSGFIYTALSYMRKNRLRITGLSSFLLSEPINGVFGAHGICFVQGRSSIENSGLCMLFSAMHFTPMFSVDFSAIPLCFMHMQSMMFLRWMFRHARFVNSINDVHSSDEKMSDSEEEDYILESNVPHSYAKGVSVSEIILTKVVHSEKKPVLRSSRRTKLAGRNTQHRNVSSSCGVQTRSSLRSTRARARNSSLVGLHKSKKFLVPQVISNKKSAPSFSPIAFYNKHKRSGRLNSVTSESSKKLRATSSTTLGPAQDFALPCCSANLLVFESDKGYRKEGALVKLEISDSGEWVLVVKIDDLASYSIKAEKIMKPCSCNRFTHYVMWSAADNSWKLEFPNRQDWFLFKDLYKECYDRNVLNGEPIPVPGISEVSGYVDNFDYSFCRPDVYISSNNDEVFRAMAKRTANYDMDTDDEGWLDKLNIEFVAQNELHEPVSEEKFELMIDAFEKGYYCSVDDSLDEKAAVVLCSDMGRKEVIEAVYSYWMKKRKQKKSSLLRIFQGHQPKRPPLIPKPPLRKRRSFKRQPSQVGRGKQSSLWRAIAAERHAMELQNAKLKAEEAKEMGSKSTELAVVKRQKAQNLFENADLATYKATMAVRIAQAAQMAESTDAAATHFLHCHANPSS